MLVLAVLAVTVALFVFEVVRVDVVAICVMIMLGLMGLVPASELFNGFASNAVISIIAVMILGAGLDRTGVMSILARFILRVISGNNVFSSPSTSSLTSACPSRNSRASRQVRTASSVV